MLAFAIRRILQTVPTVLAVVLVIFVLFSVIPGSIVIEHERRRPRSDGRRRSSSA